MLLAINANNTNVKFAVYDGEQARGDWRIRTESARTADEYVVWLSQLMGLVGLKLADITDAVIATVVPQALFNLRMLCERHLQTKPLVVGDPSVQLGIGVLMDMPAHEVGADRLANAVGGHVMFERPLMGKWRRSPSVLICGGAWLNWTATGKPSAAS